MAVNKKLEYVKNESYYQLNFCLNILILWKLDLKARILLDQAYLLAKNTFWGMVYCLLKYIFFIYAVSSIIVIRSLWPIYVFEIP